MFLAGLSWSSSLAKLISVQNPSKTSHQASLTTRLGNQAIFFFPNRDSETIIILKKNCIVATITFKFKFKLSFIVIPLHVWTYSGTRCRASQDHGAT